MNDIVMLKLSSPFTFDEFVYPVCLPPKGFDADNGINNEDQSKTTTCIISGWGVTEGKGSNAQLQHATVPVSFFKINRFLLCKKSI